jgi:hypothetical protein
MSDEIVEILESPSDAVLSSTLTPASEGGRPYSHSHLPELIRGLSFISALDIYQISLAEASSITVIGSSEDRGEVPEPCVCVCVCVCVCANPIEDEPQTVPSMIVPREDSQ